MEARPVTNSMKAWLLAARPKTLSGAATPVLIGAAAAWHDTGGFAGEGFSFTVFLLCMAFAFLMQIDANLVNDYFDYRNGNDSEGRLGPERACTEGWITPDAMKCGIAVVSVAACLTGLPLAFYGGWGMVVVGAACVLFCFLYTTFFSYKGMGDILVLVFFGLVPVSFTYFLLVGEYSWRIFIAAAACGIATDCLLLVNNYRDMDQDRANGKITLAVRLGRKGTIVLYAVSGLVAGVLAASSVASAMTLWHSLPFVLYIVLHISTSLKLRHTVGRELNALLGETSRNILILSLLFVAVSLF